MNATRRNWAYAAAAALAAVMALFPPWHPTYEGRVHYATGYAPVFAPGVYSRVDFTRLGLQLAALAAVTAAAHVLLKEDNPKT